MTDHLLTLAPLAAALLLALAATIVLARSRRWGATCTRCPWHRRTRSRSAVESAAAAHAGDTGHTCRLHRRQ